MKRISPLIILASSYFIMVAGTGACLAANGEQGELESALHEGDMAVVSGDLEAACEIYSDLLWKYPDNARINFAYGMACFELGRYSRAELAFERLTAVNPSDGRAWMMLGRCRRIAGQTELARENFKRALALDPPPKDRQHIEKLLADSGRRESRWDFSAGVNTGFFYDDNVNVGPDSETVSISPIVFGSTIISNMTLGQSSEPVSSAGAFGSLDMRMARDIGESFGWMVTSSALYYQNWLRDGEEYESIYGEAKAGLKRLGKDASIDLPVSVSHINTGGDPLVTIYGTAPAVRWLSVSSRERGWKTFGKAEYRDYIDREDRDGMYFEMGQDVSARYRGDVKSLGMRVSMFHNHAHAGHERYTGGCWEIRGSAPLPFLGPVHCGIMYKKTDYSEREALAPEEREDTEYCYTIGLRPHFGEAWYFSLNYRRTDNDSNFTLYEYTRNVISLTCGRLF
ncbi:MAG: tetratricopeptide repeat protein [Kiritimatiellia bacterium]